MSQDPREGVDHQSGRFVVRRLLYQWCEILHSELVNCERWMTCPAKWVCTCVVEVQPEGTNVDFYVAHCVLFSQLKPRGVSYIVTLLKGRYFIQQHPGEIHKFTTSFFFFNSKLF